MAITFPDPTGQPTDGSFTYTDPVNGKEYSWNGFGWDLVCSGGSGDTYVKISGDTMTGALEINAKDDTIDGDFMFAIEGDQADGGTGDNVLVARRHETNGDQVRYYGPIVFDKEVTTKEYVDQREAFLQGEIIELEEEIEALAPTSDRGVWKDEATPGSLSDGHFTMRLAGTGVPTTNYEDEDIEFILFSTNDSSGEPHDFTKTKVNDQIQFLDVTDDHYGLFKVLEIPTDFTTPTIQFRVQWLQGEGTTQEEDDVRVKFITGGGVYILRTGDTMSGSLNISNGAYNGITIFGDKSELNNSNGIIFRAENGGNYTDPSIIIGREPTHDNHAVTKKYADDLLDFSQYTELS